MIVIVAALFGEQLEKSTVQVCTVVSKCFSSHKHLMEERVYLNETSETDPVIVSIPIANF